MELKIECACGARFKFEVEPVNNRMPAPVICPSCGADATPRANALLSEMLDAPAASETPVPSIAASPSRSPVTVRLARPAQADAAVIAAPPPPRPIVHEPERAKSSAMGNLKAAFTVFLAAAVIGLGLWKFGAKWYKRLRTVAEVADVLGTSSVPGSDEVNEEQNLGFQDATVLYVKHTNHVEVAQACKTYWKEALKKNLSMTTNLVEDGVGEREYCVYPAHNGFVEIMGSLEWPQAAYEGVSAYLSRSFNTLVFETSDVDFSGAYHFGVYEQGVRKFHAQMEIKVANGEFNEITKVENKQWALDHGFKPDEEGFDGFHLGHADDITRRMGMKMWDIKEGEVAQVVLLKE